MSAIELLTMREAGQAIRLGHKTPTELVVECLARIERLDSQVSAWAALDAPQALETAHRITAETASGRYRGPLHGIPIGIKDIVDVAGFPTRAGSSLTAAAPAERDATIVARLRAAGAIILGKTVTTEFACFDPPPTRNPWNLTHTPGGSSSGSAAAVALGMCYAAIGSQTGGSITRPASYCGVAGCKPTFGRVSRTGVVPVSFHLDHVGTLARTVADCGVLLQAIAGDDSLDPAVSPRGPLELHRQSSEPPRLGIFASFFLEEAEAEVAQLTSAALDRLGREGAELERVSLPDGFEHVHRMHRRLMASEAADFHRRQFGDSRPGYGPQMAALLEEGAAISMAEYQEALRHQVAFRHALSRALAGFDALVTPATPAVAPDNLTTTGDPRFNSPWSFAGVPTVSFPCGLSATGMPTALQLIGPDWSEARLLATAGWCEAAVGFRATPPLALL